MAGEIAAALCSCSTSRKGFNEAPAQWPGKWDEPSGEEGCAYIVELQ